MFINICSTFSNTCVSDINIWFNIISLEHFIKFQATYYVFSLRLWYRPIYYIRAIFSFTCIKYHNHAFLLFQHIAISQLLFAFAPSRLSFQITLWHVSSWGSSRYLTAVMIPAHYIRAGLGHPIDNIVWNPSIPWPSDCKFPSSSSIKRVL